MAAVMLTCKGDGCSRDGTESSGYCGVCQAQRDEVFEHGGMLDGVHFEPRRGFTRETFHEDLRRVSRPVEEDEPAVPSDHRFGLRKWGRGYVWTREAALAAVREYVEAIGRQPTKRDVLLEPVGTLPSGNSATRLFGSWDEMLDATGTVPSRAQGSRRPWSREEIVEAIQRYVAEHGRIRSDDWIKPPEGCPARSTVIAKFGSWREAVNAAGFESGRPGPPKSEKVVPEEPEAEEEAATEESPPANETVEVPVDVIVELVGCAHEIERLEASLATVRDRYHGLLDQLRDVV